MTYREKLLDPRWQKKRLQIMDRDGFKCQACGDGTATLHVHHKTYTYGNEPWEYHDNNLITLCWECHHEEEYNKQSVKDRMHDLLMEGYTNGDFDIILCNLMPPLGNDWTLEKRCRVLAFCAGRKDILELADRMIEEGSDRFFDELNKPTNG